MSVKPLLNVTQLPNVLGKHIAIFLFGIVEWLKGRRPSVQANVLLFRNAELFRIDFHRGPPLYI
jgi:hypothetical protein